MWQEQFANIFVARFDHPNIPAQIGCQISMPTITHSYNHAEATNVFVFTSARRAYKHQPFISREITLTIKGIRERSAIPEREITLKDLLIAAGIVTEEEFAIVAAVASANATTLASILPCLFPAVSHIRDALETLTVKIVDRDLSFEQGVIAANHLFLTGSNLAEALSLVAKNVV